MAATKNYALTALVASALFSMPQPCAAAAAAAPEVAFAATPLNFPRVALPPLGNTKTAAPSASSSSSSSSLLAVPLPPRPAGSDRAVHPLLDAVRLPQSARSRRQVESLIDDLSVLASRRPGRLRRPIKAGRYRTVWSTVTADSFFGTLLRKPPCNVLGGPSWQIVSEDMTRGENIVYWDFCDVRMAGLARLSPLEGPSQNGERRNDKNNNNNGGYSLSISGLEFRWGAGGCPERTGRKAEGDNRLTLFELDEETTLGNGVGDLEVLYNDGIVRVTRDNVQKNTYVHVREPLGDELDTLFSP